MPARESSHGTFTSDRDRAAQLLARAVERRIHGALDESESCLLEAHTIYWSLGLAPETADCLYRLGLAYRDNGRADEAECAFAEARDSFRRLELAPSAWASEYQLGLLYADAHRYSEAEKSFTVAPRMFARDDPDADRDTDQGHGLLQVARIYTECAEDELAADSLWTAHHIFTRCGRTASAARCRLELGILRSDQGLFEEAEEHLVAALADFRRLDLQPETADCHLRLGDVHAARDDVEAASVSLADALDAFSRLGLESGVARCYYALGVLHEATGEHRDAGEALDRAMEGFERLDMRAAAAHCRYQLGLVHLSNGPLDEAEGNLIQALEAFTGLDMDAPETEWEWRRDLPLDASRWAHGSRFTGVGDVLDTSRRALTRLGLLAAAAHCEYQLGVLFDIGNRYEQAGAALIAAHRKYARLAADVRGDRTAPAVWGSRSYLDRAADVRPGWGWGRPSRTDDSRATADVLTDIRSTFSRHGLEAAVAACSFQLGVVQAATHDERAETTLARARYAFEDLGLSRAAASCRYERGLAIGATQGWDAAEDYLDAAYWTLHRLDLPALSALYLLRLGMAVDDSGEPERAGGPLLEAHDLFVAADRPIDAARCLLEHGRSAMALGDHESAENLLAQALQVFADNGMDILGAQCQLQLGRVHCARNSLDAAEEALTRALRTFDGEDLLDAALCRYWLGIVYADMGRYGLAEETLAAAESAFSDDGNRVPAALSRFRLGQVYRATCAYGRAEEHLLAAYQALDGQGLDDERADCVFEVGLTRAESGDYRLAGIALNHAHEDYERLGNDWGRALCEQALGLVYRASGELDLAQDALTRAIEDFALLDQHVEVAECQSSLGDLCATVGRRDLAAKAYAEARSTFAARGLWTRSAAVDVRRAGLLLQESRETAHAQQRQRLEERTFDLLAPAVLALDSVRFELGIPARRSTWARGKEQVGLAVALEVAWRVKPGLLAELIECSRAFGRLAPHRTATGDLASLTAPDRESGVPWSESALREEGDRDQAAVLSAAIGIANPDRPVPLRPPGMIRMPNGRIALEEAHTAVRQAYNGRSAVGPDEHQLAAQF